jgi:hypothetical protein
VTLAGAAAQTAIKTASGGSINTGIWTLVGIAITAMCGVWIAYIKQWGPWKQGDTDARAADFARLRAEIDGLKKDHKEALEIQNRRIEKLEKASSHAMRSDAKLQTALTACEVLLGLVEREMPEAKEIALVKRLLAQAASDDLGVGDGMRKLAVVRGVGE